MMMNCDFSSNFSLNVFALDVGQNSFIEESLTSMQQKKLKINHKDAFLAYFNNLYLFSNYRSKF